MNKPASAKKKLKAYFASVVVSPDITDALGLPKHQRQVELAVAAHTQKQAAYLMGCTTSFLSTYGGWRPDVEDHLAANPGQVFAGEMLSKGPKVKVGRSGKFLSMELGVETDLSFAAELEADEVAWKVEKKAKDEKRRAGYREEAEHHARNEQRCKEAIGANEDTMADMGYHPDTIVVGNAGQRTGVLIPAEVYEKLVRDAAEFHAIVGTESY